MFIDIPKVKVRAIKEEDDTKAELVGGLINNLLATDKEVAEKFKKAYIADVMDTLVNGANGGVRVRPPVKFWESCNG